eukprot:8098489-Pyramimonas_sp.AAC.1
MLTTSGTKFNCRKEDAEGEDYLGIRVFRFYFKCTRCSAELAMKTDPKNSDYIMEAGATRNFEPWREKDAEVRRRRSPLCIRVFALTSEGPLGTHKHVADFHFFKLSNTRAGADRRVPLL